MKKEALCWPLDLGIYSLFLASSSYSASEAVNKSATAYCLSVVAKAADSIEGSAKVSAQHSERSLTVPSLAVSAAPPWKVCSSLPPTTWQQHTTHPLTPNQISPLLEGSPVLMLFFCPPSSPSQHSLYTYVSLSLLASKWPTHLPISIHLSSWKAGSMFY